MKISVSVEIAAPVEKAWDAYVSPDAINQWNFASDDWQCRDAKVDLRVGGKFSSHMEAKDGSFEFDFEGTYTNIVQHNLLEYSFGDRSARVVFEQVGDSSKVTVEFDAEDENEVEMQREGWQSILNNYATYVLEH
ncbi:SRPBCC domain-containing protein [Aquiluna borgnonia]|uniref:SRPBCC domain-containing protein n=1 Tax=Aquiluna borgnonia TaxID=2499157 RepID=A0A7D4TI89_9MICO|nr:SRPBCC domain-containing protein [Aquiluna borgnonia]QKJ24651.1 SRPBCC domain-containing protein [Aquiluna borgnonia]